MDLENPSYFAVNGEIPPSFELQPLMSVATTDIASSLTRQLTPPRSKMTPRFFRSVSSNSADSAQELFIRGEPRLVDIAPEYIAQRMSSSRSSSVRSNKSKQEFLNELMYCPLPTAEEDVVELAGGDEVFISEDSARYYNFPTKETNGQRRHSIGTFMSRERSNSVNSTMSFKEEFPHGDAIASPISCVPVDDHAIRHASFPRKRCNRCTKGGPQKTVDMDDILILYLKSSNAAVLWVEYFTSYFNQISKQANRKPFRIKCLGVEEIVESSAYVKSLEDKAIGVKLQLVVACPGFMEYIAENAKQLDALGKILLPGRVLALLLGVSDDDLTELHKSVLPTYFQWKRLAVGQDQDENFTKEFLSQAMCILSRVWKQQCSVVNQEKSCFSVSPKKIRQGQNSVFILLSYPLQKEDSLKVSIERNNELIEVKSVKRRNPFTIKVTVPDCLTEVSAIVNILVEKNGSIIGSKPIKCESKLRELEQILRSCNNPVEFMCQSVGCNPNNREQLDNWLAQAFHKNMPAHFNLLINHSTPFTSTTHVHKHGYAEFPTLLHFAAKFGLEKLTLQLLDCPGADTAYEVRNVFNLTPVEIAEANGHKELAGVLRSYMNMNEFTSVYSKLKEMSQKCMSAENDGYLTPKNLEELYKICPAPRPVLNRAMIQQAISNDTIAKSTSTTPTSECAVPIGYMAMSKKEQVQSKTEKNEEPEPKHPDSQTNKDIIKEPSAFSNKSNQTAPERKCEVYEDEVQRELLEIINDYKNNVHSISQVEKLVEEWKNRNDVQKSFKEKQEQLKEMRLKYEKIQQDMKAAMKKPTPFDRVKRIFSRAKIPEEKQEISSPTSVIATNVTQRPLSSLSTSSSESSGRMSTISGSSLGDSGTHSDNEDRKNIVAGHKDDEFRNDLRNDLNKAIMELNYSAVPAPKPVKSAFFRNQIFETIEEKPVTRTDTLQLESDEYYIQFPPSGLPVPGLAEQSQKESKQSIGESSNEYMNISASPNDNDLSPTHEYMNFKIPSFR